jgi:4-hydroxy-4-methyl-2-oxoglutarate aldolase
MSFSPEQLARARAFGSATLHEAAGRVGALPSAIKPVENEWVMAGPAFTVHCPAGDNLWIHRGLYAAAPGDVLVVFASGGVEWGYWGDIMNTAAIAAGLEGLVIDGGVRDTAALARMGFPVFSHGVCIRGTIKDHDGIAFLGHAVRLGEVLVQPGDLVVGDRDGVVAIAAARVEEVLEKAAAREADEADKIARIQLGERTIDIYGWGPGGALRQPRLAAPSV